MEEDIICPSEETIYNVKRILYLQGESLTTADIIRSKRIPKSKIEKIFNVISEAGFGVVSEMISSSNRNKGDLFFKLKKLDSASINSTAIGRGRFKLFRLDKGELDSSFIQ